MTPDTQPITQQAATVVETPPAPPAAPASTKPSLPINLSKMQMIQLAAFAVIAVWTVINIALLWVNGIDLKGVIWALWWPAIFLVQYTVFTTPWRAVTVKELGRMFLIGMGLVFFASYWGELILVSIMTAYPNINPLYIIPRLDFTLGPGVSFMADIASPVVEETFKILPVIIFLLIAGRGYWKRALGPLDVALLAGASGAGFFFMENIARVISGYTSRLGPDRSSWVASPGFNPLYLFPDAYHGDSSIWLGHPEATMFVGLFLGFGLMLRKKTKLWPIVPAIGFLWIVWLHYMINGFDSGNRAFWVQVINMLHINGGMTIIVLGLGLLLSLAVAMYTKYVYLQSDKEAQVSVQIKAFQDYLKANQGQPLLIVKKLWSLRHFWSFRHAVAYGVFYAKQQKPEEVKKDWMVWLVSLRDQALGKV